MNSRLHGNFRIALRNILAIYVRIAIKKHKPTIITVVGENHSSILREALYTIFSTSKNTRRNLERTESEFSIPLSVLGNLNYPKNIWHWATFLIKTAFQLVYIKPYKHCLIIQLNFINKKIFKFWLYALSPSLILNTGLDNEEIRKYNSLKISQKEISELQNGNLSEKFKTINRQFNIDNKKAEKALSEMQTPGSRIKIIAGKNNSVIIDARHFYYPPSLQAILEIAEALPGNKHFFSSIKTDYNHIPKSYKTTKDIEKNSVYIFRGTKDQFLPEIRAISLNDLEI